LGYKARAAQQTVITNRTPDEMKIVNWSFGGGIVPQLGLGYMMNEYFGFELNASFLMGNYLTWKEEDSTGIVAYCERSTGVFISPKLLFIYPNTGHRLRPFANFGLTVSTGAKLKQIWTATYSSGDYRKVHEYKTRMAVGFNSALGCAYRLNKSLDLWVSAEGIMLAPALKSGKLTAYTINEVDQMPSLNPSSTSWNYVNKKDPTSSTDYLTAKRPFSSIGVNVGVRFNW
jgi:hypothetical protein